MSGKASRGMWAGAFLLWLLKLAIRPLHPVWASQMRGGLPVCGCGVGIYMGGTCECVWRGHACRNASRNTAKPIALGVLFRQSPNPQNHHAKTARTMPLVCWPRASIQAAAEVIHGLALTGIHSRILLPPPFFSPRQKTSCLAPSALPHQVLLQATTGPPPPPRQSLPSRVLSTPRLAPQSHHESPFASPPSFLRT